MLGIVFFFTAIVSILHPTCGTPLRDTDLDAIINLLQKREKEVTSEESTSSSIEDERPLVEHLKSMDVIDLIQRANRQKNSKVQNQNQRFKYRASRDPVNQGDSGFIFNDGSNNAIKQRIMDLLQEGKKQAKKPVHKRLAPNRLLNPVFKVEEDSDGQEVSGLNDYSKIFVVLDPVALKNSNDNIPSLVSKILASQSSLNKARADPRNKGHRYNGFSLKDRSRRFRRDSKESYGAGGGGGGGGDMDDDYRPKRPRNDHGGGGGGSGGRTAIPYIRHRGDIYERDN